MPELPEVRTVAKTLKRELLGKKITNIKIIYPKIITPESLDLTNLIGTTLTDIKTYGKYLLFYYDEYILVSHLRMEGKYNIKNIKDPIVKHEHIIFEFGDISLRYNDVRKFGRMTLIKTHDLSKIPDLKNVGLEPFEDNLTPEYLLDKFKNKNLPIKELLLDQSIMCGLGNIYVDEVLFASKINPLTKGKDITNQNAKDIKENAIKILNKATECGGSTIRSYTSSLGVIGHYQDYLMVHKREHEKCKICGTEIQRIKVGGRSTYFCSNCQK
jgi:formamidopyrimidine-DNA glycosylase